MTTFCTHDEFGLGQRCYPGLCCCEDPVDPEDTLLVDVECPCCGGEGQITYAVGVDYRDGSIIEHGHECAECNGRGGVWEPCEVRTLEDLERMYGEEAVTEARLERADG